MDDWHFCCLLRRYHCRDNKVPIGWQKQVAAVSWGGKGDVWTELLLLLYRYVAHRQVFTKQKAGVV